MSKVTALLAAAIAVAVGTSAVQAAPILNISTKIVQSNQTGTSTKIATINSQNYTAPAGTPAQDYFIEVDASVSNLDPGYSFGGLAFDIVVGGSATRPTVPLYNYRPNNPLWVDDLGGNETTWGNAKDAGVSGADLVGIVAVVDNSAAADAGTGVYGGDANDPRLNLLKTTTKIGAFQLSWDPSQGDASISLANVQFNEINDTTLQLVTPATSADSSPNQFVISGSTLTGAGVATPEPASLGILAIGGAALLARRKKA